MKIAGNKSAGKCGKVGEVVFLAEKINAARELSSCCVGTEALLEADSKPVKTGRRGPGLRDRR